MKKAIEAYHSDENKRNIIFIKAYIIDKCNYNCQYCTNKNPRTYKSLDLFKFEHFIDIVYENTQRNIILELIGGEPTLHRDFFDFCMRMHNKKYINSIYVYSNFSSDIEIYIKLLQMKKINFYLSWHSIKNDKLNKGFYYRAKKLFNMSNKATYVKSNVAFNVMLEHNNIQSSILMHKMIRMITQFVDLSMVGSLNKINNAFRYEYNDYEYMLFKEALHDRYDDPEMIIKYDDESVEYFSINKMMDYIDKKHISFYNWKCNAGIDSFYVYCNEMIWCCQQEFENGFQPIGNINNINNGLFERQPIICRCEACICEGFIYKTCYENNRLFKTF